MSRGVTIGGHTKPVGGISDEWITPKWVFEPLGEFDLDPCASPSQPWPIARESFALPERDGLNEPWFGRVWLNPPYGPRTGEWLSLLADHANGIALIFARTETRMFHRYVWEQASSVFFFWNRLTFHRPDGTQGRGNAGGPSCLVAYDGKESMGQNAAALRRLQYKGACVEVWSVR
jgi:hypothetical protein